MKAFLQLLHPPAGYSVPACTEMLLLQCRLLPVQCAQDVIFVKANTPVSMTFDADQEE